MKSTTFAQMLRHILRPVLDSDYWMIGDNPDLGGIQGLRGTAALKVGVLPQEPVDHQVFQSGDGAWHLWGCIRGTAVGRVLYHWESPALEAEHWKQTGEMIRADRTAGESINDWNTREWLQSPFTVVDNDTWYLFYGGHGSGVTERGAVAWSEVGSKNAKMDCQMCLMTSGDGRAWTRRKNGDGQSRIFLGPGETRDPCVVWIDGLWFLYYAGYHEGDQGNPGFYARTSSDLIHWSDWTIVHRDQSGRYGSGNWNCECPHVVYRGGYYYLFRTEDYGSARTHVFRSEDPLNFGIGNAADKYVGPIEAAAPEIVVDPQSGGEYISSNHDLDGGTRMARLRWQET
jgi:hypothetical protein